MINVTNKNGDRSIATHVAQINFPSVAGPFNAAGLIDKDFSVVYMSIPKDTFKTTLKTSYVMMLSRDRHGIMK